MAAPPAFDHALMLGGSFTPNATQILQLPRVPGLPDNQLHDVRTNPGINQVVDSTDINDQAFLTATYQWIAHPVLDSINPDENWEHCHNGLLTARRRRWLQAEHVYHLTERLLTWSQDQQHARLGGRTTGNWWLAPELCVLYLRDSSYPSNSQDQLPAAPGLNDGLFTAAQASQNTSKFNRATFTIHFVHCNGNHWSLLIYERPTGKSWYFDSLHDPYTNERSDNARLALLNWLQTSNLPVPTVLPPLIDHENCKVKDQKDKWSCSLHSIANALAFIRYEVLGWHRIPQWQNSTTPARARNDILVCLHRLMGLKFTPRGPRGKPKTKTAAAPAQPPQDQGDGEGKATAAPTGQGQAKAAPPPPPPTASARTQTSPGRRPAAAAERRAAAVAANSTIPPASSAAPPAPGPLANTAPQPPVASAPARTSPRLKAGEAAQKRAAATAAAANPTVPPTKPTVPPTNPTVPPTKPTVPPTNPTVPPTNPQPPPPPPPPPPPLNTFGVRRPPRGRALVESMRAQAQADHTARVNRLWGRNNAQPSTTATGNTTRSTPAKTTSKRKADALDQDGTTTRQAQSTPSKKHKSAGADLTRAVQSSPITETQDGKTAADGTTTRKSLKRKAGDTVQDNNSQAQNGSKKQKTGNGGGATTSTQPQQQQPQQTGDDSNHTRTDTSARASWPRMTRTSPRLLARNQGQQGGGNNGTGPAGPAGTGQGQNGGGGNGGAADAGRTITSRKRKASSM